MSAVLTGAQLARDLAITDVCDPAGGPPHAIQLVAELAASALTSAWHQWAVAQDPHGQGGWAGAGVAGRP